MSAGWARIYRTRSTCGSSRSRRTAAFSHASKCQGSQLHRSTPFYRPGHAVRRVWHSSALTENTVICCPVYAYICVCRALAACPNTNTTHRSFWCYIPLLRQGSGDVGESRGNGERGAAGQEGAGGASTRTTSSNTPHAHAAPQVLPPLCTSYAPLDRWRGGGGRVQLVACACTHLQCAIIRLPRICRRQRASTAHASAADAAKIQTHDETQF